MLAMTKKFVLFLALATVGCDREQPAAPTTEQTGQLNEAEDLLNQLDKQEGAAPSGTAPPQNNAY